MNMKKTDNSDIHKGEDRLSCFLLEPQLLSPHPLGHPYGLVCLDMTQSDSMQ